MTGARRAAFALGLLLFAAALAAPRPEGLSEAGQRTAAVALLMSTWWIGEAIPIAATALVPLVLFPLLGVLTAPETSQEYGNPVVFLFLGAFLIALAMERWGLHRRIALAMVAAVGASPQRLVLGFLAATALVSMWINNTAVTLMMFPVGVSVAEHLASRAGDGDADAAREVRESFGAALMLGIAYGASLGGMGTLVGTAPNLILTGAVKQLFPALPEIGFLPWMAIGVPVTLGLVAVCYGAVVRLAPVVPLARIAVGDGGRDAVRAQRRAQGPMSPAERWVLAAFAAAALLWIFRAPLEIGALHVPGWSSRLPRPGALHDATVAVGIGLLLFMVSSRGSAAPEGGRAPLLDWDTVQRRVPWGVLFLMGGGFALATGFERSGLSAWIGGELKGLAGVPLPLVIAAVCTLTTLLSEIASNTATATMLMPILGATAEAIGAPPLLLLVPATLAASCGFMLPVATPPNTIVFATGWIPMRSMLRAGLALDVAGVAIITLVCSLAVPWVFAGRGG
jgi:sodium-dependent dicarboxylate transporter 2/3/5